MLAGFLNTLVHCNTVKPPKRNVNCRDVLLSIMRISKKCLLYFLNDLHFKISLLSFTCKESPKMITDQNSCTMCVYYRICGFGLGRRSCAGGSGCRTNRSYMSLVVGAVLQIAVLVQELVLKIRPLQFP